MKLRADAWSKQAVPYGSEIAWDSTGQEGSYYWSNYFNLTTTVTKTINSNLGYMPTVAHWGWNGNARRYWHFIYAGKLQRIERMIHHYDSSLNALPFLAQYRQAPNDTYLLRVGYGGITGPLSNIRQDGSMYNGFHSFPDTLRGDAYSGDYGPNFLGVILGLGVYVVDELGLVTFGGDMVVTGGRVVVKPRDALRRRVYIGRMGVYITLSAGWIGEVEFDDGAGDGSLRVRVVPGPVGASRAVVWVEMPATGDVYAVTEGQKGKERSGWVVEIGSGGTDVIVSRV